MKTDARTHRVPLFWLLLLLMVFLLVSFLIYRYFMTEVRDRLTLAHGSPERQNDSTYTFMQSGDDHAA